MAAEIQQPSLDNIVTAEQSFIGATSPDDMYSLNSDIQTHSIVPPIDEPPMQTPTFYSPAEAPQFFTPTPASVALPPGQLSSSNAYRLSAKKKIYAAAPGLNSMSTGVAAAPSQASHSNVGNLPPIVTPASMPTQQQIQLPHQSQDTQMQSMVAATEPKPENGKFSFSSLFSTPKLFQPLSSFAGGQQPSEPPSDFFTVGSSDLPSYPVLPQSSATVINPSLFNTTPIELKPPIAQTQSAFNTSSINAIPFFTPPNMAPSMSQSNVTPFMAPPAIPDQPQHPSPYPTPPPPSIGQHCAGAQQNQFRSSSTSNFITQQSFASGTSHVDPVPLFALPQAPTNVTQFLPDATDSVDPSAQSLPMTAATIGDASAHCSPAADQPTHLIQPAVSHSSELFAPPQRAQQQGSPFPEQIPPQNVELTGPPAFQPISMSSQRPFDNQHAVQTTNQPPAAVPLFMPQQVASYSFLPASVPTAQMPLPPQPTPPPPPSVLNCSSNIQGNQMPSTTSLFYQQSANVPQSAVVQGQYAVQSIEQQSDMTPLLQPTMAPQHQPSPQPTPPPPTTNFFTQQQTNPIAQSRPPTGLPLPPTATHPPPTGLSASSASYRLRGRPHYKSPLSAYGSSPATSFMNPPQMPQFTPSSINIFNPVATDVSAVEKFVQPAVTTQSSAPPNYFNPSSIASGTPFESYASASTDNVYGSIPSQQPSSMPLFAPPETGFIQNTSQQPPFMTPSSNVPIVGQTSTPIGSYYNQMVQDMSAAGSMLPPQSPQPTVINPGQIASVPLFAAPQPTDKLCQKPAITSQPADNTISGQLASMPLAAASLPAHGINLNEDNTGSTLSGALPIMETSSVAAKEEKTDEHPSILFYSGTSAENQLTPAVVQSTAVTNSTVAAKFDQELSVCDPDLTQPFVAENTRHTEHDSTIAPAVANDSASTFGFENLTINPVSDSLDNSTSKEELSTIERSDEVDEEVPLINQTELENQPPAKSDQSMMLNYFSDSRTSAATSNVANFFGQTPAATVDNSANWFNSSQPNQSQSGDLSQINFFNPTIAAPIASAPPSNDISTYSEIQNFFNNPPPLSDTQQREQSYIANNSINKRLQHIAATSIIAAGGIGEAASISSNLVEPASSAQSEFSETLDNAIATTQRSDSFLLERNQVISVSNVG